MHSTDPRRSAIPVTREELNQIILAVFLTTPGCLKAGIGSRPWMLLRLAAPDREVLFEADALPLDGQTRLVFHLSTAYEADLGEAETLALHLGTRVEEFGERVAERRQLVTD